MKPIIAAQPLNFSASGVIGVDVFDALNIKDVPRDRAYKYPHIL